MVKSCSAYGCKNRWSKVKNIQFHEFPHNDPERLQMWLIAMKRDSWKPTRSSVICGEHFAKDSYKSGSKHFLKDDAVPSIFSFSPHLSKIVKGKRTIQKHELPMSVKKPVSSLQKNATSRETNLKNNPKFSSCSEDDTLSKSRKVSLNASSSFETSELKIFKESVCDGKYVNYENEDNDFSDIEFSDSEDAKQRLDKVTAHYKKTRKKLKICQQRCRLYKKEITALNEVIDSLRQINSISDDN